MKIDLLYLYKERLEILNNDIISKDFRRKQLEKTEFEILELPRGYELLINLKNISTYRKYLEYKNLLKEEKEELILKIFNSTKKCENILNVHEDYLLDLNEIILKKWFKFKFLINNLKINILLCGNKL